MKHLIKLWPGYWVKNMARINEAVGMKNSFTIDGGGKRLVCPFKRQELWKCIGCVLLEVAYGKRVGSKYQKILVG